MGYFITAQEQVDSPVSGRNFKAKTDVSGRSFLAKTDLPSKNRVMGFQTTSESSAWTFARQPVEPHQETRDTSTKTVSGLRCWLGRDPIGERGGLCLYGFAGNSISVIDYLGLVDCSAEKQRYQSHKNAVDNLKKKIKNILDEIADRIKEMWENKGNLPYPHEEGKKLSETIQGHEILLDEYRKALEQNQQQLEKQQKWLDAAEKAYADCEKELSKDCADAAERETMKAKAFDFGADALTGIAVGAAAFDLVAIAILAPEIVIPSVPAGLRAVNAY